MAVASRLLMCLAIVLIPLGVRLIQQSQAKLRHKLIITVEGELYRARGIVSTDAGSSEAFDVVADTRVVLEGFVGRAKDDGAPGRVHPNSASHPEIKHSRDDCQRVVRRFDDMLPSVIVPAIRASGRTQSAS